MSRRIRSGTKPSPHQHRLDGKNLEMPDSSHDSHFQRMGHGPASSGLGSVVPPIRKWQHIHRRSNPETTAQTHRLLLELDC